MLFAHTPPIEAPNATWHGLGEHLRGCAVQAAAHLSPCGQSEWGRQAGLLHDLGKATPEWQAYLQACVAQPGMTPTKVDHKLSGALFAGRSRLAGPLAFAVAGHHGGLPDRSDLAARLSEPEREARLERALGNLPMNLVVPPLPSWVGESRKPAQGKRRLELFTRILFSALVDADFLDTEAYYARCGKASSRRSLESRGQAPPLQAYLPALEAHLASFRSDTPVRRLRAEVLEALRAGASGPRGAYTLTVPTGGGKTLAGLDWALRHAKTHGLRRVIVALPFTTIIEQTSEVFRLAFAELGPHAVLEHHSNLDPDRESSASRVASENWDSPLIVTTQVQLFESLLANNPSTCRKLHNLQDAVLILDEVQSLPRSLLAPILDVLNDLGAHYGTSLLLMTATQPELGVRDTASGRFPGLEPVPRELIPESLAPRLWEGLRRVETYWPRDWAAPDPQMPGYWDALAVRVLEHPRVLAITHLKRDAQALFGAIHRQDPEVSHLSAAMCPAHRRGVLAQVKSRLSEGVPCRLVSTQVVEAGVDLDFPVVFRAMAGLESMAQSAGRCNREGALEAPGRFLVYDPPTTPPGSLKEHQTVARTLLQEDPALDLFHPQTFSDYFRWLYYEPARLDVQGIQPLRESLRFQTIAEAFRMIPEATTPVFVPWDDKAKSLLERLRHGGPSRDVLRQLQPYTVAVHHRAFREVQEQGSLEMIHDAFFALFQAPGPNYDVATGFHADADSTALLMA